MKKQKLSENTKKILGEFLGSAFISFWGLGFAVPFKVLGYVSNVFEHALWFGLACTLSAIIFAPICGAHFNSGVTLVQVIFRKFDKKLLLPYWIAQTLGWGAGVLPICIVFNNIFDEWVSTTRINPATLFYCSSPADKLMAGAGIETLMAAMLTFSIFALSDESLPNKPSKTASPWVIGIIISMLIAFGGGFSNTCINSSRDLGPRIFALIYGLIKGYDVSGIFADGQWLMYIVAPTIGAVLGAAFHFGVVKKLLPKPE